MQSDYFSKTSKQRSSLSINVSITRLHDTRDTRINENKMFANFKALMVTVMCRAVIEHIALLPKKMLAEVNFSAENQRCY